MKFRAFVGEHPEKFKTKMKDEVLSFNHHKDSSKSEIFCNPGAKILTMASLSISALISRTTATGNWIPIDEAIYPLILSSLDYDCSTDLPSNMDNSVSHSSGIPSKLYHQEKDKERHKVLRKTA